MHFLILILSLLPVWSIQSGEQPILQEITLPKNLIENQTVKLNCDLIHGDNVEFNWYFNNEKLIENNRKRTKLVDGSSNLLIKHLSIDDIGKYECIGSNEYGQDRKDVDLLFDGKYS